MIFLSPICQNATPTTLSEAHDAKLLYCLHFYAALLSEIVTPTALFKARTAEMPHPLHVWLHERLKSVTPTTLSGLHVQKKLYCLQIVWCSFFGKDANMTTLTMFL